MVCATIGTDIIYNVSNIFVTTSLKSDQQGIAGACINGTVFLGMSFFLGWADLTATLSSPNDLAGGVRSAFLMAVGCAGAALILVILGIRIPKAKGSLTADEREALEGGSGMDAQVASKSADGS